MSSIEVAVAIITKVHTVLLAKRHPQQHQGGLWEFPGGKLEKGETPLSALQREIKEEVNLDIQSAKKCLLILHHYADKKVLLHVYRVIDFAGTAQSNEGQMLRWIAISDLDQYAFPKANHAILQALRLPEYYSITPDIITSDWMDNFEKTLQSGISLIQLRSKQKNVPKAVILQCQQLCQQFAARLILNIPNALEYLSLVEGIHLTSKNIYRIDNNTITKIQQQTKIVGASCHNEQDIQRANNLHLDYIFVSPVAKTSSHPDAITLGWDGFEMLQQQAKMPVYALGGMQKKESSQAQQYGAWGIAGISALWVNS